MEEYYGGARLFSLWWPRSKAGKSIRERERSKDHKSYGFASMIYPDTPRRMLHQPPRQILKPIKWYYILTATPISKFLLLQDSVTIVLFKDPGSTRLYCYPFPIVVNYPWHLSYSGASLTSDLLWYTGLSKNTNKLLGYMCTNVTSALYFLIFLLQYYIRAVTLQFHLFELWLSPNF